MIARIFAVLLLVAASAAAGIEAVRSIEAGAYDAFTAGEVWYAIDRASLNLVQATVQRHLAPALWDWVLQPLLTLPAWVVIGVPALVLLWIAKPRSRGRFAARRKS